jgi:hypothetical protein
MADLLRARLDGELVLSAEGPIRAHAELSSAEACAALLEAAGLVDVEVRTERIGYHLRPEEWWVVAEHGVLGEAIDRVLPAAGVRLREAHLAEVARLAGSDGLWLDVQTHYAAGRKP